MIRWGEGILLSLPSSQPIHPYYITMETTAHELELYATNVKCWIAPVIKTLSKKWRQGVFDYGRAVAYVDRYCLVPAAKQYKLEYGSMTTPWNQMFDKPTRTLAAESIVTQWVAEFKIGNFWE